MTGISARQLNKSLLLRVSINAFLFICLGVIDYICSSLDGMTQQISREFVEIILMVLFFVNIENKSKKMRIVQSLNGIIGIYAIVIIFLYRNNLNGMVNALGVVAYFCVVSVLIFTFSFFRSNIRFLMTKNAVCGLCILLLTLILISMSDNRWPLTVIPIVFCLCVICNSKEKIESLFHGLCLGVIISFFCIQGCAFVFRPYDIVRYNGMFTNCNINALFYLCAFVAFLCEALFTYVSQRKWRRIICMVMAPVCMGFTLFTMCRTAIIAEGMVCFALLFVFIVKKTKWNKLLINVSIFAVATLVSIPIIYCAIRFIPPIFHHPIWLWDEYSESRVHSFDPIDSEKYISPEEAGVEFVSRYLWFSDEAQKLIKPDTPSPKTTGEVIAETKIDPRINELLDAGVVPLLSKEEMNQADSVRLGIWKGYIMMLNLRGHKKAESELLLGEDYIAPHAHNVFIMSAFDYGIPAGIVFSLIYIMTIVKGVELIVKRKDEYLGIVALFWAISFGLFGFFETNWGEGKLSVIVFILLQVISANCKGGAIVEKQ